MTPKVNQILSEIKQLVERAAWGPEIPSNPSSSFQQGEAGIGQADNESNIQDAVDTYINNICQALVDEFGISEENAYDYVEHAANEMESEGMLPALPAPEDSDSDAAMWLGVAKSSGFEGYCLKLARDHLAAAKPSYRSGHSSSGF